MILTDEPTRTKHLETGVWGTVTLDAIFRKTAQTYPQRLALADAPDRTEWTSGAPERLTYGEAEHLVSRISALFSHLGLAQDHVVAIMMPNTVSTVLTYLAAWRCGLIVVPIPLNWRRQSILPLLEKLGAKAIITIDRIEGEDLSSQVRDIAAELFGIRQLLGFGDTLAEGIINIEHAVGEIDPAAARPEMRRKEHPADHVATVTFTGTADGRIVPVPRSHNQWIAAGLMPLLEARIETAASILSPFMLTGLSGIGAGLIPWILSSGTLHLHHFRQISQFAEHCAAEAPDHVLCPAALVEALAPALTNRGARTDLLCLWPGVHGSADPASVAPHSVVDVTILDELALVARQRGANPRPYPLTLGTISVPTGSDQALALVELSSAKPGDRPEQTGMPREVLLVRGPMAPSRKVMRSCEFVQATEQGFLETSILARVSRADPMTAIPEINAGRPMIATPPPPADAPSSPLEAVSPRLEPAAAAAVQRHTEPDLQPAEKTG